MGGFGRALFEKMTYHAKASSMEIHKLDSKISWHHSLTSKKCKSAQVCSHRGKLSKGAPAKSDSFFGLLAIGVNCVDLDAFSTADGFLLVGRESDITGSNHSREDLEAMSLSQVQALHPFPLVTQVLSSFKATLAKKQRKLSEIWATSKPLLFIELKGRAFNENHISYIHQQAHGMGIGNNLLIWAVDEIQVSLASALSHRLGLQFGIAIPDRDPNAISWALPPIKSNLFSIAAPSIRVDPSTQSSIQETGVKMAVWIVDTETDLEKALELRADIVITNEPQSISKMIKQKCH